MSYVSDATDFFGRRYDTWRLEQLTRRQNRRQQRRERREENDEALAYRLRQADLLAARKAKINAEKLAEATARDQRRGYAVDWKRVVMAYGVELVIAGASAYGQYLFALQYGTGWLTTRQMMLAPIAYAMVELCRVPLALSTRSHRHRLIRIAALLGVIGAAGITVKSMSQLGNIMFAPRLTEVVIARENLDLAKAADEQITQRIAVADDLVKQRSTELQSLIAKEQAASSQLASLPKTVCHPASWYDRRAQAVIKTSVCSPDSRNAPLTANLNVAQLDVKNAQTVLESAQAERAALDRGPADKSLSEAQKTYREAVRQSQLHDFAAMVWGVSPTEVTDAMVARFLRVFVFGAAICVAFASTMIAITAITRVRPAKPSSISIDDRNGEFILQPFAEKVIAEAKAAVKADAEAKIARAANVSGAGAAVLGE